MPLSAIVGDDRVVAFLLDEDAWTGLKADLKTGRRSAVLSCGSEAYGRTSTLGTPHFVHKRGAVCSNHGPESAQHLFAKMVITRAARDAGWDAQPEVPGPDRTWVADVLATRGNLKVALEVQWTEQSLQEFQRRQDRYKEHGVRAVWFTRHTRHLGPSTKDLPVFGLTVDGQKATANIEDVAVPLDESVRALLTGRLQHRARHGIHLGTWATTLHEVTCRKCGLAPVVWKTTARGATPCGQTFWTRSDMFSMRRLESHPQVLQAVSGKCEGKPVADIGMITTKDSGGTYNGFTCPNCHAVYGDFYLDRDIANSPSFAGIRTQITAPLVSHGPHWCHTAKGVPCPDIEPTATLVPPATRAVNGHSPSISVKDAVRTVLGGF